MVEIDKVIVKLKWAYKEPTIARTILKKKITVGGLVLSNFQELLKSYRDQERVVLVKG